MKKLLMILAVVIVLPMATSANNYFIDETEIDLLIENATEIDYEMEASLVVGVKSQTVGGFLIRSFFCGGIALHRYYMGTGGKSMWWRYFCIPVVGSVANCVDFWWVVFSGNSALQQYRNNSKFLVWAGN